MDFLKDYETFIPMRVGQIDGKSVIASPSDKDGWWDAYKNEHGSTSWKDIGEYPFDKLFPTWEHLQISVILGSKIWDYSISDSEAVWWLKSRALHKDYDPKKTKTFSDKEKSHYLVQVTAETHKKLLQLD